MVWIFLEFWLFPGNQSNCVLLQYISCEKESAIKWAKVVIISPNSVSIPKMIVIFGCAKKMSKIYYSYCFSIVLYCLWTIEQWASLKINKGTTVFEFLFYFSNLTIKISILTKFQGNSFIFAGITGLYCLSLFWSKMTSFFGLKWVIAPQAKIVEVWKLPCKLVLLVYTWI